MNKSIPIKTKWQLFIGAYSFLMLCATIEGFGMSLRDFLMPFAVFIVAVLASLVILLIFLFVMLGRLEETSGCPPHDEL